DLTTLVDGPAWRARLHDGPILLGHLANDGNGATVFEAEDRSARRAMDDFVAGCRLPWDRENTEPLAEFVYDLLKIEHDQATAVATAHRQCRYLIRAAPLGFEMYDGPMMLPLTVAGGVFPDYRRAYEAALRTELPPRVFRVELWMGQTRGWVRIRPAPDVS
ncbi:MULTISPECIES: hypothetical protein, partial [unclassified Nocardiopsis]